MKKSEENLCQDPVFEVFYKSHLQSATNFAYYKCGDKDNALDLVQEGFSKLWENCFKLELTKAKTYLFTTINNLFLNKVKHAKVVLAYANDQPYLDRNNQSPDYVLEEKQFKAKLLNAIAALTEAQREVFLLNRIDGKKYREIADDLNISQKAVEKRMSSALKTLRTKIDHL